MKTPTESTNFKVEFDSFEYILLMDMLSDVINNDGKLDEDLMDYLDTDSDNNAFVSLYNKLIQAM